MTDKRDLAGMDGRDLVLNLHPISQAAPEHICRAGDELGYLAHYLVHTTLPERVEQTLPCPVAIDDLLRNVRQAVETLPQLLHQAALRMTALAAHPRVAIDNLDEGPPAEQRARDAATGLCEPAAMLRQAGTRLGSIRRKTVHLKVHPDG